MKKIIIVCGGVFDEDLAREFLQEKDRYVIAADRGLSHLIRMGIRPDAVIGDFDSVSEMDRVAIETYERIGDAKVVRLNPVKDSTDTEAALRMAMEQEGEIIILGATGRRLDHSLANIRLLGLGLETGRSITIMDTLNRMRMCSTEHGSKGHITISRSEQYGKYVSVFPVGGPVRGLSMRGFAYSLEDTDIDDFSTLTVSNEITAEEGDITFKEGTLLVVESRDA